MTQKLVSVQDIQNNGFKWEQNIMILANPTDKPGEYYPGSSIYVVGYVQDADGPKCVGWIGYNKGETCVICQRNVPIICCKSCKKEFCWNHIYYDVNSHQRKWYQYVYCHTCAENPS